MIRTGHICRNKLFSRAAPSIKNIWADASAPTVRFAGGGAALAADEDVNTLQKLTIRSRRRMDLQLDHRNV